MTRYRNPYSTMQLYVGKMKPLNDGLYSRQQAKSNNKPKQKIYIEPYQEYFWKPRKFKI